MKCILEIDEWLIQEVKKHALKTGLQPSDYMINAIRSQVLQANDLERKIITEKTFKIVSDTSTTDKLRIWSFE